MTKPAFLQQGIHQGSKVSYTRLLGYTPEVVQNPDLPHGKEVLRKYMRFHENTLSCVSEHDIQKTSVYFQLPDVLETSIPPKKNRAGWP